MRSSFRPLLNNSLKHNNSWFMSRKKSFQINTKDNHQVTPKLLFYMHLNQNLQPSHPNRLNKDQPQLVHADWITCS